MCPSFEERVVRRMVRDQRAAKPAQGQASWQARSAAPSPPAAFNAASTALSHSPVPSSFSYFLMQVSQASPGVGSGALSFSLQYEDVAQAVAQRVVAQTHVDSASSAVVLPDG
jgi:hypothetical protein